MPTDLTAPATHAALRFLIFSEDLFNYAAVEHLLAEDQSANVIERSRERMPFAPSLSLIVTTISVALQQHELRWLGEDTVPANLASLVEAASSAEDILKVFSATNNKLELIKAAAGNDETDANVLVELVQLPKSDEMLHLYDTDQHAYYDTLIRILVVLFRSDIVPQGLIFASGYPGGVNPSSVESLSQYLAQYGKFCPNVTLLFTDYIPHIVLMNGDEYLNVSERVDKITINLNRPDLPIAALPVATTMPLAGRAARIAFYYQQRAALIDLLSKCARDSKLTAGSARVEKGEIVKMWLSSVLVGVEIIRKGLAATKTLLASDLVETIKEAEVCANILSDNTREIGTRDRHAKLQPFQDAHQAAVARVPKLQRNEQYKWLAELDALHEAISADTILVATLLAMCEPLIRLMAQLKSEYPEPEVADAVELAVAFVAGKEVARELL
ncbi:hypothetical protein GGF32_005697 [Allomyces javanicus]|nr:hypothetical protein GGF32_005697 [Allomyces javanicus]